MGRVRGWNGIIPDIGDLTLTSRQRWSHPLIDNNPGDFKFHQQTFAGGNDHDRSYLIFSKCLKKTNSSVSLLFIELLYKLCVHYQISAAEEKRNKIKSKDWQKLRCTCCVWHKFKVYEIICTKWQLSHFHPMNLWTSFVVDFTLIPTNVLIWKPLWTAKHRKNCECCPVSQLIVR